MTSKDALIMKLVDNVATVIQDIEVGDVVAARIGKKKVTVEAKEKVPFGFKIALTDIPKGELILKYGETIGRASTPIKKGQLVHIHNLEGTRGRGDIEGGARP